MRSRISAQSPAPLSEFGARPPAFPTHLTDHRLCIPYSTLCVLRFHSHTLALVHSVHPVSIVPHVAWLELLETAVLSVSQIDTEVPFDLGKVACVGCRIESIRRQPAEIVAGALKIRVSASQVTSRFALALRNKINVTRGLHVVVRPCCCQTLHPISTSDGVPDEVHHIFLDQDID